MRTSVMSPVSRSIPALLALVAVACPWVLFLAVAAYAVDHEHAHGAAAGRRSDIVDMALHGHGHEPGTPEHEHSLVAAQPAPASTRMSMIRVPASPGRFDSCPPRPVDRWSVRPSGPGESPPEPHRPPSVLRI